jgi:hypothetical protein
MQQCLGKLWAIAHQTACPAVTAVKAIMLTCRWPPHAFSGRQEAPQLHGCTFPYMHCTEAGTTADLLSIKNTSHELPSVAHSR